MIHLIKNYYAAPNNMGFTLLKEKNRKDKKGNTTYETLGYYKRNYGCNQGSDIMNKAERREQRARDSQIITKEVYLYFLRYFQKHGYSPSYQEIADALNIHIQTVRRHIAELMEDGLLATDHPGTPRTIRVTGYKFKKERER